MRHGETRTRAERALAGALGLAALLLWLGAGAAPAAEAEGEEPEVPSDVSGELGEEGVAVPQAVGAEPPAEAPAAEAADESAAAEGAEPAPGVEVITVTTRKREESLQSVPSSVVAFSSRKLQESDITDLERLGQFAPNLQLLSLPLGRSTGSLQLGVRGRVQNDFLISLSNSVGFYVDDVFYGKSIGFPLELLDVEAIQVDRGPQGTLYGKNTPAGAVKVRTRKPTGDWGFYEDVRLGNFEYVQTRTTLNFPFLGEKGMLPGGEAGSLSGKVTFLRTSRGAVYDNNNPGTFTTPFPAGAAKQAAFFQNGRLATEGFLNEDRFAGLVVLDWDIGAFGADYVYDVQNLQDEPDAFQLNALFTTTADGFGGTQNTLLRPLNCSLLMDTSAGCIGGNPFTALGPFVQTDRSKDTPSPGPTPGEVKIQGHALTLTYGLEDLPALGDLTLKSITGYRSSRAVGSEHLEGAPYVLFSNFQDFGFRAVQEEINLVGNTLNGHFDYVLGLFYGSEEGHQGSGDIVGATLPSLVPYCTAVPAFCGGRVLDLTALNDSEVDNWSIAPFGQLTYTFDLPADQTLSLTGGARYTYEERKVSVFRIGSLFTTMTPVFSISGEKSFDDISPMGSLAYKPFEDKMLYATISQGYRSGGFNGRATTAGDFGPFKDEVVTNYEAGFKTQWFDRRLLVNATGFYQDWNDMQVTVFIPSATGSLTVVSNAGKAEFWGMELESQVVPFDGALLGIGYGLTLAEFSKFEDTCPATSISGPCLGNSGALIDVSDVRPVTHHPNHSLRWDASYTFPPVFDFGVLSARIGGYYQSSVNYSAARNAFIQSQPYHILDARIQLAQVPLFRDSVDATFAIWGKNLTDAEYILNGIDLGVLGFASVAYGERLTFGGQIVLEWGASR